MSLKDKFNTSINPVTADQHRTSYKENDPVILTTGERGVISNNSRAYQGLYEVSVNENKRLVNVKAIQEIDLEAQNIREKIEKFNNISAEEKINHPGTKRLLDDIKNEIAI